MILTNDWSCFAGGTEAERGTVFVLIDSSPWSLKNQWSGEPSLSGNNSTIRLLCTKLPVLGSKNTVEYLW